MTEKIDKLMTSKEAADYLGLTLSYFRKLMMWRAIPMYKPGGKKCYFMREDLDAYLLSVRIPSQSEIDDVATNYLISNGLKGRE